MVYLPSMDRNIEQLITVMHNDFERVVTHLEQTNQRVDQLTDRVGILMEEVRDVKTEAQTTNRRSQSTFDHTGHLTEENTAKEARLVKLETDNTELWQRPSVVEEFMRRAS